MTEAVWGQSWGIQPLPCRCLTPGALGRWWEGRGGLGAEGSVLAQARGGVPEKSVDVSGCIMVGKVRNRVRDLNPLGNQDTCSFPYEYAEPRVPPG